MPFSLRDNFWVLGSSPKPYFKGNFDIKILAAGTIFYLSGAIIDYGSWLK